MTKVGVTSRHSGFVSHSSFGLGHSSLMSGPAGRLSERSLRLRGLATLALGGGLGGATGGDEYIQALGKPASLARGSVLVDRPLGSSLIQTLRGLTELFLGLVDIVPTEGGGEALDLILHQLLAGAITRTALGCLTDAFLSGKRMGHGLSPHSQLHATATSDRVARAWK